MPRYEQQALVKHLEKNHSWLLTEFINKSARQFINKISSEITGNDFRETGFREYKCSWQSSRRPHQPKLIIKTDPQI